ncbi:MAG: cell division protein SepF [Candidatus Nanopelagicales bacterium]|jgi:cell division inhibitor SepF
MAGAMRKMAVYLGLVEDDRDDVDGYFDEEEEWEYEEPAPTRRSSRTSSRSSERSSRTSSYDQPERVDRAEPRTVTVVDPREPRRLYRDEPSNVSAMPGVSRGREYEPEPAPVDLNRITTIHPHTYNDARRIGEEFRQGIPVIMNLTEMDDGDAKRIVDFAAGLVFGLHGTIERVTNKVFLLSPANVEVGAEARAQLAQTGFFNQS